MTTHVARYAGETSAPHGIVDARPPPAGTPTLRSGRAAIVFRPFERIHLGSALLLTAPLRRLTADRFPRTVLLLDFGTEGKRSPVTGLTESCLDRIACLPSDAAARVSLATAVPSIARLAALVASTVLANERARVDSRIWFREVLLAAGLVATRATHAVVEALTPPVDNPDTGSPLGPRALTTDHPGSDLMLARRLAAGIDRVLPGTSTFPVPLLSGFSLFRSLDSDAPMGTSAKGTLYLSDSPDKIVRKVRAARTDGCAYLDPYHEVSTGVTNLLLLLHAMTNVPVVELIDRFTGRPYSEIKTVFADAVNAFLHPIRMRRAELLESEADLAASIRSASWEAECEARTIADALAGSPELLAA